MCFRPGLATKVTGSTTRFDRSRTGNASWLGLACSWIIRARASGPTVSFVELMRSSRQFRTSFRSFARLQLLKFGIGDQGLYEQGDFTQVMIPLIFRHQIHGDNRHRHCIGRAVIDPRRTPPHDAHQVFIERHASMGASPAFADSGIGRMFPFHDQSDHIGAGGYRWNRLDNVRQKLQGIIFIVIGQFDQPAFLQRIQQGIHDHSPP